MKEGLNNFRSCEQFTTNRHPADVFNSRAYRHEGATIGEQADNPRWLGVSLVQADWHAWSGS